MWKIVFAKEISELLRDRRVVFGSFVMPIFSIFLMFKLFGMIGDSVNKQQKEKIYFVAGQETSQIAQSLKENEVKTVANIAEGRKMIEDGKAKLVVDLGSTVASAVEGKQLKITALYDSTEPLSNIMFRSFSAQISETYDNQALEALKAKGITSVDLHPVVVEPEDLAKPNAKKGADLASLLPYLVILWAFYGGMGNVSDMVAGEKERGTMETLLLSPISRRNVALGKFASLYLICFASSLCALIGVVLAPKLTMSKSPMLSGSISVSLEGFATIAISLIPLVALFTAILLAVSTWAKNMREAQTYLTVVSFIVLIPAVMSNLIGLMDFGKEQWVSYVPILSNSVALRSALLDKPNWSTAIGSGLICLVIAGVLLGLIIRMFGNERILSRI